MRAEGDLKAFLYKCKNRMIAHDAPANFFTLFLPVGISVGTVMIPIMAY